MSSDLNEYLRGEKLWGDDFGPEQLEQWWREEEEGYSGVVADRERDYEYGYHGLNRLQFFDRTVVPEGAVALGLGSALGHEFLPVADRLASLTIVEPSDDFASRHVLGDLEVSYRKPAVDGRLDFPDDSFDLITCFGVLHHVPNVSAVLAECFRCLRPGAAMFCREPIVTQGDWTQTRPGLTRNERGIPLELFKSIARGAGFRIQRSVLFDFAPYMRLMHNLGQPALRRPITARLDRLFSVLFSFNTKYHRTRLLEKFGPGSLAMTLIKDP